jgi:hypothetical protein
MIIRPVVTREFTAIPNALLNDRRLSADTRTMIALTISKPRGWQVRPMPLAKALSREGAKPLGRTRLTRMFEEAMAAGYMARSEKQQHADDGRWGSYVYFVGMPDDVAAAVEREGVAILPHARHPHTDEPHTDDPRARNQHTNHKRENLQKTESKNSLPLPFPAQAARPQGQPSKGNERKGYQIIERQEVVEQRVAVRLGGGDAECGWLLFGSLPDARRDELTAMERRGTLSDVEIACIRANASALADKRFRKDGR